MKVLYIIDTINGSGAERSLVEIASNFVAVTPVFVHIYRGDMLKYSLTSQGIKVYSLNITEKYGYSKAVTALEEIYKNEKPNIIHSTLYRSDMIARKMKSKFPEIPLVGSFVNNSYNPLRYLNKSPTLKIKLYLSYLQDKISSKKVDYFISNSETIKKAEGNALGISASKIEVIYRGRDPEKFNNLDFIDKSNLIEELGLKGKRILLNVSRLIERKGQLDLIKVLPEILQTQPNAHLVIAGHGSFQTDLQNEINKLGIVNNVTLLGRYDRIPELLFIADLFLYPSYAEGLPGALIEAMMSSKIIINSNIGENMECVDHNSSISYKVGDLKELKDNILKVLNNTQEFEYLGLNASNLALKKFSIKMISKQYEDAYNKLLSR